MTFPCYTSYEEVLFIFPVLYDFKDSLHQICHTIHNDPCSYAVDRNGQFILDGICWLCKVSIIRFKIYVVSRGYGNKMSSDLYFRSGFWLKSRIFKLKRGIYFKITRNIAYLCKEIFKHTLLYLENKFLISYFW